MVETKPDQSLLIHLKVVISLIEGRPVDLADIVFIVENILRQHSFDKEAKYVYPVPYSDNLPP